MNENPHSPGRGWPEKFRDAFRGVKVGVRGQSSFFVHLFFAAAVIGTERAQHRQPIRCRQCEVTRL